MRKMAAQFLAKSPAGAERDHAINPEPYTLTKPSTPQTSNSKP